jgi:hypothetical protein
MKSLDELAEAAVEEYHQTVRAHGSGNDLLEWLFKAGHAAAMKSDVVKGLVEALHTAEKLARSTEAPKSASDHTYIKALRMKFREQKRKALAAFDAQVKGE